MVDEASPSDTDGNASSSFISIVPVAVPNAALDGLVNVTEKVSSYSSVVSAKMPTDMIWLTTPGAKVTVPVALV